MGTTCFLLLSCLGLAIIVQAQDCSRPVGGENMNLKGTDITLETYPDGTQVTFACDVGYQPAGGSGTIRCTAGVWSAVSLRCEKKSCGSAGEVENGEIDYSNGNEFGDKIVITCKPGFRLVGNREITCGDKGWLGRLPVCEVVTCDPPPAVQNGSYSPIRDIYAYAEVVQYTCKNDFTLSGSKSISCSDKGTFHPNPPTCTRVQCREPNVENGEWVEGARPPYGDKATVTYKCITGFKMEGSPTFTCEVPGQWSPAEPTCKLVTCGPPPEVAGGTFSPNKESYNYKESVEYSCQENFALHGTKTLSCSEEGTFGPAPPTCVKMPTPTKPSTTPTTTTPTTTTTTTTATATDPPAGSGGQSVIGWVLGIAAIIILCCCGCCGYRHFKKKKGNGGPDIIATNPEEEMTLSSHPKSPTADIEAGSHLEKSSDNEYN